jgi:O-antigen/teichoic acid export membrane protein
MKLKAALIRNSLASGWGKISTVLFRLIQIPVLLSFLGVEDYGRWLVLYSFPSWISLANLGFGSVASNEMSMAAAAGNLDKAKTVYSTTLALVSAIFVAGLLLVSGIVPFLPSEKLLKLPAERHTEITLVIIWFTISTLLTFFGEVYEARFRSARKAHMPVILYSFRPWFELLGMVVVLQFSHRFDYLAIAVLCTTVIYTIAMKWLSYRSIREITFSTSFIQKAQFRPLFKKGLSFQAFPLGNALIFQGNILVVQVILGPVAVAIFGSVRTLVRSINQMFELINQVMWPELSLLFGVGDYTRIARLHRIGVAVSIAAAFFCVACLALVGQPLYAFWTHNSIPLQQSLLLLFLLPIPFNALWFTSSVIHMASNQYEGLAVRYLIAMVLAIIACAILSQLFGIKGAAVSTLISDIVLIPFVLKQSLHLTHDTWAGFKTGIMQEAAHLPAYLQRFYPASLMKKEKKTE